MKVRFSFEITLSREAVVVLVEIGLELIKLAAHLWLGL